MAEGPIHKTTYGLQNERLPVQQARVCTLEPAEPRRHQNYDAYALMILQHRPRA